MSAGFQLDVLGPPAYERHLVPTFFAPLADELLALLPPRRSERVLDLACGTGVVARRAVERVGPDGHVVGVDVNPEMIDCAARVSAGSPIEWRVAEAAELPLPDASIDLLFCAQGWQFFADQQAAAREAARVLRPDGRLVLAIWRAIEQNPVFAILARVLDRHAGSAAARTMRSPFAGPEPAELRAQLEAASLGAVRLRIASLLVRFPSVPEFLRQEAAGSPLGPALRAVGHSVLTALVTELETALATYVDDDGLVLPMQTWLVTARPADVRQPTNARS